MTKALTYDLIQNRIHEAQAIIERTKEGIIAANHLIDELHGEIGDLLAAARALARLDGSFTSTPLQPKQSSNVKEFDPDQRLGNPYRASTNKAFMWKALAEADSAWMTANEIQEVATKLRGSEVPMSSVSPGLSEMKQDGTIERDGMKVALKSRLKENGETEVSPDAEEVTASSNNSQQINDLLG